MRSEAVEQFVESLKKRVKEQKLKDDVERTFLEEAVNFLIPLFNSNIGPFVKGVKNYKSKDFSSYIDVETPDGGKLKTLIKDSIKKIDRKFRWYDLGDLVIISCNLDSLKMVSGNDDNPILIEVYPSPTESSLRIRVMLGNRDKHCGKVLRKNMKWVTWIWDGKLTKLELNRVDPFSPEILFYGENGGQNFQVVTELDYSGFNYEILSINKV